MRRTGLKVIRRSFLCLSFSANVAIYSLLLMQFCSFAVPAAASRRKRIQGTVTYRERMAMPPDAVVTVTLEDTSKADAKADVIAQTTIEKPGNPPVRFVLAYDPAKIDATRSYGIRAQITEGGRLLFASAQAQPVLAAGAEGEVSLLLRRAASAAAATLEGTHWTLTSLKGEALPAGTRRAPYLALDAKTHRVSGFSGCNQITGSYALDGDRLTFGPAAGTMMACVTGMDIERKFKEVLPQVSRWSIDGQGLDLLDSGGYPVAHFAASTAEEQPQ